MQAKKLYGNCGRLTSINSAVQTTNCRQVPIFSSNTDRARIGANKLGSKSVLLAQVGFQMPLQRQHSIGIRKPSRLGTSPGFRHFIRN